MMQFVIAAPRSGSGKTTVTCALLAALKKRGMDPCAFKSGPDYIDPMFHRSVLGVESHNLDLYLSAKNTVRELYAHYAAGHGAVVCEGAMGFYDGQGLTTRASAWELADALDLPVLLVVQPKGASVTLAAEIQGLVHFKPESHIAGILLNDCSEKLFRMLKPLLETETGLPVLGYLPRLPQAVVESRHLGLKTAGEITDLAQKIGLLADALEANLDWATLEALTECQRAGKIRYIGVSNETAFGVMRYLHLADKHDLPRIVTIQNPYSLLNRSYEVGLAEVTQYEEVELLAYSCLGFGTLTGKYLNGAKPAGARNTLFSRFTRYSGEQTQKAVAAYVDIAKRHGLDPAQMALAFVRLQPFVASTLLGATTMEQLKTNIESFHLNLSEEVLAEIEAVHQVYTYPAP